MGPGVPLLLLAPLFQPPAGSELRQPRGAGRGLESDVLLAGNGSGWLPGGRRALPGGARGHFLRKPAGNPWRSKVPARENWTSNSPGRCCWRKPTSGRRTFGPILATGTNATWRFISRSCRACLWRSGWRTASPSSTFSGKRPPSRTPASGACFFATTTSLPWRW